MVMPAAPSVLPKVWHRNVAMSTVTITTFDCDEVALYHNRADNNAAQISLDIFEESDTRIAADMTQPERLD
jgi:hypothetical protein